MHFLVSQMRESRERRRDEEPRPNHSRSLSHTRSESRSPRSRPMRSNRRRVEIRSLSPPSRLHSRQEPFLITVEPTSGDAVRADVRSSEIRTGTGLSNSSGNSRDNDTSTPPGDAGVAVSEAQFPTSAPTPCRNQRTFARPWRFQEIYSDWSLASIHRIFWLSVAFIHIGIFLLFIGGFFHKAPSGLASSLVSLGIFILSCGLAMYTLAKSIITARARQCQRVLQVVLDFVEPTEAARESSQREVDRNRQSIIGVVGAPPPYEEPPPYPGEAQDGEAEAMVATAIGATVVPTSNRNQKPEDNAELIAGCLPPTYSSIDIPEEIDRDLELNRGDLPPAYSERP